MVFAMAGITVGAQTPVSQQPSASTVEAAPAPTQTTPPALAPTPAAPQPGSARAPASRDRFGRVDDIGGNLLDPAFWSDLAAAAPAELAGLNALLRNWWADASINATGAGAAAAGLLALLIAAVALMLRRLLRRRVTRMPTPRRFERAVAALIVLVTVTATLPFIVAATVLALRNFGLMTDPVAEIGLGLAIGIAAANFGRGVGVALFAPGEPERRIVGVSDRPARSYAAHLAWAARACGAAVFLDVGHQVLDAPAAPILATGALMALAVLGIIVHFLWRSAQDAFGVAASAGGARGDALTWVRAVLWVVTAALGIALATGYAGFATVLAGRTVAAFALGGTAAVLVIFIDAALTDRLASNTPAGQRVAVLFGLTPRGLDLVELLVAMGLRIVIVVLAAMLVFSSFDITDDGIFGRFRRFGSGFALGEISLSPAALIAAVALLAGGIIALRAAQRWLQVSFLPRTGLDAGLQNSISALFGYAVLVGIVALALGVLGIDLQKIALIAGALSVGIGFGLQSVVSNFVCGLILLAERPIRVGDWVVVKNEEGWVRRISVRATEIETFDRASVIIPNQDFITGVVKNWNSRQHDGPHHHQGPRQL